MKKIFINILVIFMLTPFPAHSFMGGSKTGGMSEIYSAGTRIKVDGGFVERYDDNKVTVRAKGLELSLNIDNSLSNEDVSLDFVVKNINPETTKIIGWSGDEMKKKANSIAFSVDVKAQKVAVYKLGPEASEGPLRFIVFGEGKGGEHVLDRIMGDINYRKPLFAISCGDMVEEPTSSGYKLFLKKIDSLKVPFFTVVGSSEVIEGSRREYEDHLGATYYSFDFKEYHFIFLDNADGRMSEEQFLWLENDLMLNKALNTFVFMHLPPFDPRPGREQPLEIGGQNKRLSALLEKYKVKAAFSAGIHGYFRKEINGVPYVITGGGGSELADKDAFHNYVIVEIAGDDIEDKLIKLAMTPLGFIDRTKRNVKLFLKNSFQVHPFRSSLVTIVVLLFLASIFAMLFRRPPKRKPKISF